MKLPTKAFAKQSTPHLGVIFSMAISSLAIVYLLFIIMDLLSSMESTVVRYGATYFIHPNDVSLFIYCSMLILLSFVFFFYLVAKYKSTVNRFLFAVLLMTLAFNIGAGLNHKLMVYSPYTGINCFGPAHRCYVKNYPINLWWSLPLTDYFIGIPGGYTNMAITNSIKETELTPVSIPNSKFLNTAIDG